VPPPAVCGDGVAQGPKEQCDDGNRLVGDGCNIDCRIERPLPVVCGDGLAVTPEQCDDGNLVNGDGCSAWCVIEVPPTLVCGNGIAQGPREQCDDGNFVSGDGCSGDCQMETRGLEDRGLTVLDHGTGLEWEKKTDEGGTHDKDNGYTWSTGWDSPDGTAFTVFLAALNGGAWLGTEDRPECFAGHCDWRLPTIGELKTILDCSQAGPCVDRIFGPTQSNVYWSSSSDADNPSRAWGVLFYAGFYGPLPKTDGHYVRAVRGGS